SKSQPADSAARPVRWGRGGWELLDIRTAVPLASRPSPGIRPGATAELKGRIQPAPRLGWLAFAVVSVVPSAYSGRRLDHKTFEAIGPKPTAGRLDHPPRIGAGSPVWESSEVIHLEGGRSCGIRGDSPGPKSP